MANFRMGGFDAIPPVTKNIIIVNALILLAEYITERTGAFNMFNLLALHDFRSEYFRPHQFITYMFLHQDFWHFFFNMFALYMFGALLEQRWGPKRFLIFYTVCGLGAAALNFGIMYAQLTPYIEQLRAIPPDSISAADYQDLMRGVNSYMIGASGAVFGCLAAFGYLFPNMMIYLYFFVPIKAKWFVLLYAGMELWLGIRSSASDPVAHWAHLGGALVGFLLVLYWNRTDRRNFY